MERGLSDLRRAYSEPLKVLMVIVAVVLADRLRQHRQPAAGPLDGAGEPAVRQALGVARTRIMRQLLTESLMLAFAGGALAIGFAAAANRVLLAMLPHGQQHTIPLDVPLNLRLPAFTFVVTVCTAVLFGTLPSLRATRLQLTESLKSGSGAAPAAARLPLGENL